MGHTEWLGGPHLPRGLQKCFFISFFFFSFFYDIGLLTLGVLEKARKKIYNMSQTAVFKNLPVHFFFRV